MLVLSARIYTNGLVIEADDLHAPLHLEDRHRT